MSNQRDELNIESWDPDHYETGSTRPPKSYGGLVAVLLVAVILLGGVCSTLGIINMKLIRQLAALQQPEETLPLFQSPEGTDPNGTEHIQDVYQCSGFGCLGLEGQTVSDFDRRFYNMPHGVLVLSVDESGSALSAGILSGDVITAVGDRGVTGSEDLLQVLEDHQPSDRVILTVYRPKTGETLKLSATLSEE